MSDETKHAISLADSVAESVKKYFIELKDLDPVDLYQFVLEEVEMPLFKAVMEHCKYNQSRAASLLGISRGTLRTKLRLYFDDKYVGSWD
ncbi:MAG: helix-turn-helix domain-containing protein [Legionella sp.]